MRGRWFGPVDTKETKATTDPAAPAMLPGEDGRAVPPWFPGWAREFAEQYFSGTTCLFLLHGNVHDLTWLPENGAATYGNLPRLLATQLFGLWDLVLRYDLS